MIGYDDHLADWCVESICQKFEGFRHVLVYLKNLCRSWRAVVRRSNPIHEEHSSRLVIVRFRERSFSRRASKKLAVFGRNHCLSSIAPIGGNRASAVVRL